MGIILAIVAVILVVIAIKTYNSLLPMLNELDKAKSNIRVNQAQIGKLLKKMVSVVGTSYQHEFEAINNATNIHSQHQMLTALAEKYPELKSVESYNSLNDKIQQLYGSITARQEEYNNIVGTYNTAIGTFPTIIFATILGFKKADFIGQENLDKAIELGNVEDIDGIDIV